MPKTYYGYDIRTALCLNCGAPLDVEVGGGRVVCEYCRTPNLVRRRRDQQDRRRVTIIAQRPAIPESERLRQLALQDHAPLQIPPALQAWTRDGQLLLQHQKAALQSWLQYRTVMVRGGGAIEAQYLFSLTLLLAPLLEDRHERALLENAVDALPDINHRNIIRCRLAHHAAVEGDQDAAEKWLAPVDPRPRDLMADTAYRLAVCYIALTRGMPNGVFQQLGRNEGDVPIFDGYDEEAFLLRCHAFEASGDVEQAIARLMARLANSAHFAPLVSLAQHDTRFILCPKSMRRVEQAQWSIADRQLRPPRWDGTAVFVSLVMLGLCAAVVAWLFAEVQIKTPMRGEDIGMIFGIGWLVPVCLYVAYNAAKRATRNASMHDHGVTTFARILATRVATNPNTNMAVTNIVAAVAHEGVAYEVTTQVNEARSDLHGELAALFDPESKALKLLVPPQRLDKSITIVPFG